MIFKDSLGFQTIDWAHYKIVSKTSTQRGSRPSSCARGRGCSYAGSVIGYGEKHQSVATRTGPRINPF